MLENIFGSAYKDAMNKQEGAGKQRRTVPLHPYSPLRARWDALIVCLTLYLALAGPWRLAFEANPLGSLLGIELAADSVLLADVWVNFQTGVDDGGVLNMEAAAVQAAYMHGWLAADVLGSLPHALVPALVYARAASAQTAAAAPAPAVPAPAADVAASGAATASGGGPSDDDTGFSAAIQELLVSRLWPLLNLLALLRMWRYVAKWQHMLPLDIHGLRLLQLMILSLLFAHVQGCLQFYVQLVQGFPDDGWVMVNGLEAVSTTTLYSFTLMRGVALVVSCDTGTSDSVPHGAAEFWFLLISQLMAGFFWTVIVGIMSTLVMAMDRSGSLYVEKLQLWSDYCYSRRLPRRLRKRVIDFLNLTHANRRAINEAELLQELPADLRSELALHAAAPLVATTPLLQGAAPELVRALVAVLQKELFLPGDRVFRRGDMADGMYFIVEGVIQIKAGDTVFTSLGAGSYFGEFGLLQALEGGPGTRSSDACVSADGHSELFKLSVEDAERLIRYHPEVLEFLQQMAVARSAYNNLRTLGQQLAAQDSGSSSGTGGGGSGSAGGSGVEASLCSSSGGKEGPLLGRRRKQSVAVYADAGCEALMPDTPDTPRAQRGAPQTPAAGSAPAASTASERQAGTTDVPDAGAAGSGSAGPHTSWHHTLSRLSSSVWLAGQQLVGDGSTGLDDLGPGSPAPCARTASPPAESPSAHPGGASSRRFRRNASVVSFLRAVTASHVEGGLDAASSTRAEHAPAATTTAAAAAGGGGGTEAPAEQPAPGIVGGDDGMADEQHDCSSGRLTCSYVAEPAEQPPAAIAGRASSGVASHQGPHSLAGVRSASALRAQGQGAVSQQGVWELLQLGTSSARPRQSSAFSNALEAAFDRAAAAAAEERVAPRYPAGREASTAQALMPSGLLLAGRGDAARPSHGRLRAAADCVAFLSRVSAMQLEGALGARVQGARPEGGGGDEGGGAGAMQRAAELAGHTGGGRAGDGPAGPSEHTGGLQQQQQQQQEGGG